MTHYSKGTVKASNFFAPPEHIQHRDKMVKYRGFYVLVLTSKGIEVIIFFGTPTNVRTTNVRNDKRQNDKRQKGQT